MSRSAVRDWMGTREHLPVEGECRLLALVLSMEVSDAVLAVEQADDDAEEDRDDRHPFFLRVSQPAAYNSLASLTARSRAGK